MNKILLGSITLAFCPLAPAQGYITTPKGMLANEGGLYAQLFGAWSNARFHQVDGTHVGSAGHTITKIAFRLDHRHHDYFSATGRSWTNIKLDVSETDFDKLSASFSQNIIGKQTTVFDSKWTWEGQSGAPLLRPAAWGGPGGKLSFPFHTAWVYSGRKAMLMDYRFRGGALANGVPWSFNSHYFFLDGTPTSGFAVASGELLPSSLKGCTDGYWASTKYGAVAISSAYATAFGSSAQGLRNKLQFTLMGQFLGWRAAAIHAIGLGGSKTGVHIGVPCQRLYVDLSKPTILLSLRGLIVNRYWIVPWQPVMSDLPVYVQAAWADSVTGAFKLTVASRVTLPHRLPSSVLPQFRSIHSQNPAAAEGRGPVLNGGLFPITQYTVR